MTLLTKRVLFVMRWISELTIKDKFPAKAYNGARSNLVTLSTPKGERNGEHKADLNTGEVLSTRL
jgi:hypothetical protein